MHVVHHASFVLPGDAPAIADGAVVVASADADVPPGTILDVGAAAEILPRYAGAPVERHRGVVFPGLVNAHTHLELSGLRGVVRGGRGFVPWVEELIGARAEASPEHDDAAIERAVDELVAFGTVAVGDVTNTLAAVTKLAGAGIAGSIFHEVFGHDPVSTMRRVTELADERAARVPSWPAELSYAPAPHTLYTTHPDVVRALLRDARALGARTSVHFAEHASERRAIEHDDGPVLDWLAARTKRRPSFPKRALLDYAADLGVIARDVLLVHLTDAKPDEIARIAESCAPVVLCPRSNLAIEVRLPPLLAILEAGVLPGLGTDSLASSPSLDVLAEARALADRFPSVPADVLVRMATVGGARALGRDDLGRIVKGARPGLVAIEGDVTGDPSAFVLQHVKAPRRVLATRVAVAAPSPTSSEPSS